MRLIDADALIEFCAERWIPLNIDAVNMQPTIQPVATDTNVGDTISRQAAIDAINSWRGRFSEEYNEAIDDCENSIKELPTAQPEQTGIDAREAVYNLAEKIGIHQLFALTVELRGEPIQPEPQEGHWIPHETPDGGEQYECSECGVLWEFNDGTPEDNEAYFCPKCGAKMTISTK